MANCWKHGDYEGWECPTCAQVEATLKAGEEAAEAAREAGDQAAEAAREAADRAAEATYTAALESQIQGAIQHEETIEAQRETVRQHALLARDGWKLEVQSKVQRGLELLNNKMPSEASAVLGSAIATDPANMYGHLYLALSHLLMGKGNSEEAGRHRKLWAAHLTKAVQLLGTSDYSDLHAHAELARCFWIPDDDEHGLPETSAARALLHQKISTYISQFSVDEIFVDKDRCFLMAYVDDGWTIFLPEVVEAVQPNLLRADYVKAALERGAADSAALASARIWKNGAETWKPGNVRWMEGALCAYEVKQKAGLGTPKESVQAIEQWNIDTQAALFERLPADSETLQGLVSEDAWASFKGDLLALYDRLRIALYNRLDRLASERAPKYSKYGLGTGCGLAVGALFFGLLLGVLVTLPQTNQRVVEETFTLFGCASLLFAPLFALVLVKILNASRRRSNLEEAIREARAGQQNLEISIGYGGPSTTLAPNHSVSSPGV